MKFGCFAAGAAPTAVCNFTIFTSPRGATASSLIFLLRAQALSARCSATPGSDRYQIKRATAFVPVSTHLRKKKQLRRPANNLHTDGRTDGHVLLVGEIVYARSGSRVMYRAAQKTTGLAIDGGAFVKNVVLRAALEVFSSLRQARG